MYKDKRKLHTSLIETGREVEGMKQTPDLADMEMTFQALKFAMNLKDMQGMRRYGRQLAARVTKFMIEKL